MSTGLKRSVWNTARHCFKINKQLGVIHISHLSPEAEEEEDQEFKAIRLHSEFEGCGKQNKIKLFEK